MNNDPLFTRRGRDLGSADRISCAAEAAVSGTRLSADWRPFVPGSREPFLPEVSGFTFLGTGEFRCPNNVEGEKRFAVPVYRSDALVDALIRAGHLDHTPAPGEALDTEFVLLPPPGHDGRFAMGSPEDEDGRQFVEDLRDVRIARPFLIARTAVTQRVYDAIGGRRSEEYWCPGALQPAEGMSWNDATEWCAKVGLRLPTEAEWEFACRAGTQTRYCFGSHITEEQVHYNTDGTETVEVGSLPVNAMGLFEMHGNVWEWCQDHFTDYPNDCVDGSAVLLDRPHSRVYRGGSLNMHPDTCRSARRSGAAQQNNAGRHLRLPSGRRTAPHTGPGFRPASSVD